MFWAMGLEGPLGAYRDYKGQTIGPYRIQKGPYRALKPLPTLKQNVWTREDQAFWKDHGGTPHFV